jgi:PAS domain S-box-containing protein
MRDRQGEVTGLILVSGKQNGEFTSEEETLLVQLAALASLSWQHIQARQEAERRADELHAVINAITDGVAIYDVEGKLVQVNPAAIDTYGFNPIGETLKTFIRKLSLRHPDGQPARDEELPSSLALQGETHRNVPFIIGNERGKESHVMISSAPLKKEDRLWGAVTVYHDVTELKTAQEALDAYARRLERTNREIQDFAFFSSHDLQEPLRKIQAFSNRLEVRYGDVLDETGRDYLKRMQSAAARMKLMITDLLAYSRVTTEARPFVRVDLNTVIQDVLSDLDVRIEQSSGQVILSALPEIEADALQIHKLLQNLVANALKFHQPSVPPVVKIWSQPEPGLPHPQGARVQILVEDNGIGFEEQYAERIFQPFQRLQGRSEYEGTGIGLAICRKIVERHDGVIQAKSTLNQGTCFIITLPIRHLA